MKIKVSEATPLQLDWLVARALGKRPSIFILELTGKLAPEHNYSTDWSQGGPIIEANNIQTWKDDCSNDWLASPFGVTSMDTAGVYHSGPTLLIAAMKCYVASQLGEEVEVPDELA